MPRTKQQFDAMREAARQRITAAGLRLFAQKGLAATSIQDIAAQAGISVGLLYHYYRSKEDLFIELAELAMRSAAQGIDAIFSQDRSPAEKIRQFSAEMLEDIRTGEFTSQFFMLMINASLNEDTPQEALRFRDAAYAPLERVAGVIAEGQRRGEMRSGDPTQLSLLYFAAIQGLAIYKLTMGSRYVAPQPEMLDALLLA